MALSPHQVFLFQSVLILLVPPTTSVFITSRGLAETIIEWLLRETDAFCMWMCILGSRVHPLEEPGTCSDVPPCQRQRGLKAAELGSRYHLQAVFLPIHPAGVIVSSPFNASRSDQLSQATSSIVNKTLDGRIGNKKKENGVEEEIEERTLSILTGALWRWSCSQSAEGRRDGRSSFLTSYLRFSMKINLASSHLPSDGVVGAAGVRGVGVVTWATKR